MSRRLFGELVLLLAILSMTCGTTLANVDDLVMSDIGNRTARSTVFENGFTRSLKHIYSQCTENEDFFWCFKIQATKLLGRALKVQNINIIDGFTIVRNADYDDEKFGRAYSGNDLYLSNKDMENLSMKSLDSLLYERFYRFIQSRQVQITLPRMLRYAERNGQEFLQDLVNYISSFFENVDNGNTTEGRKKKDDKKYLGMFVAAVMLKAAILKMAYHSIAIIAGKALIVGKIALIISAIIGLKKLVSSEGGEKTTYEIVKHPQVQQSHTYSSSHTGGEYEGGHESASSGSYHRSIADDEMMMQDKAYHAWIPTTKIS